MIKAIETVYNGYRFRSRLEARWAVFFDACGYPWEYEPEGFNIDGIYYLPDFKVAFEDENGDFNTFWFEVKPRDKFISEQEKRKINAFACACFEKKNRPITGYGDFILLDGTPEQKLYEGVVHPGIDGCKWILEPIYRGRPHFTDGTYEDAVSMLTCGRFGDSPYDKARQARFEHGENGNGPRQVLPNKPLAQVVEKPPRQSWRMRSMQNKAGLACSP